LAATTGAAASATPNFITNEKLRMVRTMAMSATEADA